MDSTPADDRRHVSVTKFSASHSLRHTHRQAYITHVCKCDLHWSDPLCCAAIDNWQQESITGTTETQLPLLQCNHVTYIAHTPHKHRTSCAVGQNSSDWQVAPSCRSLSVKYAASFVAFWRFWPRNVVQRGTFYAKVCPSVCHTHTHQSRENSSTYRNTSHTIRLMDVSSFLRQYFAILNLRFTTSNALERRPCREQKMYQNLRNGAQYEESYYKWHPGSRMGFPLVLKSVTFNNLERSNGRYFVLFHRIRQIRPPITSPWLKLDHAVCDINVA